MVESKEFLGGNVRMQYPQIQGNFSLTLWQQTFSLQTSSFFFKAILFGTFALGAYGVLKQMFRLTKSTVASCKSLFNPAKFLSSGSADTKTRHFAVIYGACNRAGKAFGHFLARRGFSLILIDRAMESLERVR